MDKEEFAKFMNDNYNELVISFVEENIERFNVFCLRNFDDSLGTRIDAVMDRCENG